MCWLDEIGGYAIVEYCPLICMPRPVGEAKERTGWKNQARGLNEDADEEAEGIRVAGLGYLPAGTKRRRRPPCSPLHARIKIEKSAYASCCLERKVSA